MTKELWIVFARWLITWIWISIPAIVGGLLYWYTKELLYPMVLFFLMINKGLFDVYEAINELKEQKAGENQQWRSMLSKRKSL